MPRPESWGFIKGNGMRFYLEDFGMEEKIRHEIAETNASNIAHNKTDRELIELAVKAIRYYQPSASLQGSSNFDPLNHDGDALRLAVTLQLNIYNQQLTVGDAFSPLNTNSITSYPDTVWPKHLRDNSITEKDYAATRRAIVLAAAEIGMQLK